MLLIPLAETIKELDNFILNGVINQIYTIQYEEYDRQMLESTCC